MVVLWTDALIYLLLLALLAAGIYLGKKPQMRRPLRKIGRNKTGMVSLTLLAFFLSIGLLDSVHFESDQGHSHEIVSLLDYWAEPIRSHDEKTYSAPFSSYLYSKEFMTLEDGTKQWGYPRLQHGGAHLRDPENERAADVATKALVGFAKGAGLCLFALALLWSLNKELRRRLFDDPSLPAVLWVVSAIVSVGYMLIDLSLYYHVFGTDKVGEDVFYQTVKSIRTGLVIGTLTTMIMLPLAIVFGILAGFFRGWVDDVIQYFYTTLNSIPSVLLIAASILTVQVYIANHPEDFTSVTVRADMRLLFLCLILGVTNWTGLCRLLRAETLKLREMEYVLAARTLGVRRGAILYRHILPNVMHIVIISVVLDFSSLVLAEAVLSYINIGVDPTTYSWGNMINGARL
ncbi:MAG: ABC transporter permease, partial [Gammaproteobacteria bacterium]